MWKKPIRYALNGILIGIAFNYIVAVILSYTLHLGYLMPYPALLPENVGGEMNAMLVTMLVCGWFGGGIGLALHFIQSNGMKVFYRSAFSILSFCVSLSPALVIFFVIL